MSDNPLDRLKVNYNPHGIPYYYAEVSADGIEWHKRRVIGSKFSDNNVAAVHSSDIATFVCEKRGSYLITIWNKCRDPELIPEVPEEYLRECPSCSHKFNIDDAHTWNQKYCSSGDDMCNCGGELTFIECPSCKKEYEDDE